MAYLPSAFYPDGVDDVGRLLRDYALSGAKHLVMPHRWCVRMLTDADFAKRCGCQAYEYGLEFSDAHGPYGVQFDLNGEGTGLDAHEKILGFCADLGVKTYCMHLGVLRAGESVQEALDVVRRTVGALLPVAEKYRIVLALENIYSPLAASENILRILSEHESAFLRFCYDSGHANIMTRGVRDASHCHWVANSWAKAGLKPTVQDFEPLLPYLVTCHLHGNNGGDDAHRPPGDADDNIDWKKILRWIRSAPALLSLQTEVHCETYHLGAAEILKIFSEVVDR